MSAPRCACGGRLQAASSLYWTLEDDGTWVIVDAAQEEMRFTCENDCSPDEFGLTDEQMSAVWLSLSDAILDMGFTVVADRAHYAVLSGLLPARNARHIQKLTEVGLIDLEDAPGPEGCCCSTNPGECPVHEPDHDNEGTTT